MEKLGNTLSTATLIAAFVLATTLPAAAGDAVWSESTDPAGVFVGSLDIPNGLDGVLERLAARSHSSTRYVGAAERLAARLVSPSTVAAAAPANCGDHADHTLLAE